MVYDGKNGLPIARPSAGLQPPTCPRVSLGHRRVRGRRWCLANPVMALLLCHFFRGASCPSSPLECQRLTGRSHQTQAMPLWRASAPHGGHAKPGDAPLVSQGSIGGCTKTGDATLAGQRLTGGLCQAWRCPTGVPVLDIGVAPSPAMPLWHASTRQGGQAKPGNAPLVCQ